MSNMSYCRHENTSHDLRDVLAQWNDWAEQNEAGGESDYESRARRHILEQAVASPVPWRNASCCSRTTASPPTPSTRRSTSPTTCAEPLARSLTTLPAPRHPHPRETPMQAR